MKLTALLLFISCMHICAAGLSQTVSLEARNLSLEEVFSEIKQQTGYGVFINKTLLDKAGPVSIKAIQMPLATFLDRVLGEKQLRYEISMTTIVVSAVAETPDGSTTGGNKLAASSINLILAYPEVKGRVVDSLGNPLRGASVRVLNPQGKRTALQTTTDREGYFVLRNVPENAMLEVSYMGYITVQLKVSALMGQIVLRADPTQLDEVVINKGYYTTSQRLNTGSVVKVTADQLEGQPVSNPIMALQGKVPGLQISASSGVPGAAVNVLLRGRGSLQNGTLPLFIVDGVPFNPAESSSATSLMPLIFQSPLNTLNIDDIESVEVLKDADATAIYGSRGANGVVLITTKKGQPGEMHTEMNASTGFSNMASSYQLMNTQQYLEMRREAFANDGVAPTISNAPDLLVWDTTRYTDWQKVLLGNTAKSHNVQLSASGGDAHTQYAVGAGYHFDGTVMPTDDGDTKWSSRMSIQHSSLNGRFRIAASAGYLVDVNKLPGTLSLGNYILLPPDAPEIYNPDGSLHWETGFSNPLAGFYQPFVGKTGNLNGNLNLEYHPMDGWILKVNGGYNQYEVDESRLTYQEYYSPTSSSRPANASFRSSTKSWIVEPQIQYSHPISAGNLEVLLGGSWQSKQFNSLSVYGSQYANNDLLWSIGAAGKISSSNSFKEYAYEGIFGRINYNWKNRYILNITGRRDGSSRFGPADRFNYFASAGGAWIFSEEAWARSALPFLSLGKMRASYGTSGNDQIGDYQYLDLWSSSSSYNYQGVATLNPKGLYNPYYNWERNRKLEAALELGFFKQRLNLSAAYYRNRSGNQLYSAKLATQTGFATMTMNQDALIQNSGYEFTVNSRNISRQDWSWNTQLNISFNRNKLLAYPDLAYSYYSTYYAIGRPLKDNYGYRSLGVDPQTGEYMYADLNGDGVINSPADLVLYDELPTEFFGSFTNDIRYKGLSLSFSFYFTRQYTDYGYLNNQPGSMYNEPVEILARWQKPGDQTVIPKYSTLYGNWFNLRTDSDMGRANASFVRLQNLALGFEVPTKLVRKFGAKTFRLFTNGQNLLTFTAYKRNDPESLQSTFPPTMRTYVIGFQLGF
ncbi:TonB-linked outer membrane protein, SusC/RagA family [bacterium A37T11]|nr:TonB-linked outer membrane protein, SusC/RagA family [bacterium A37T11]